MYQLRRRHQIHQPSIYNWVEVSEITGISKSSVRRYFKGLTVKDGKEVSAKRSIDNTLQRYVTNDLRKVVMTELMDLVIDIYKFSNDNDQIRAMIENCLNNLPKAEN